MRRYASERECDDFGVSVTRTVTRSPKIDPRYVGKPHRDICLKDVVCWLENYPLNYSLAFNNCQHFARGIFEKFFR